MPLVSVILPTHNRAATLKRAIDSVLNQTFEDFELVIVNDGSTDNSQEMLDAYSDRRMHCYNLAHAGGAAAARNYGIENSHSAHVAFQDSDDEWQPDKLSLQLESINNSYAGLVYSHMLRIDQTGNETIFLAPDGEYEGLYDTHSCKYHVENIGIQSCLIRRECLYKAGLFDENMPALEDLDLFIRLDKVCAAHRIDLPLVKYYASEGLSSNFKAQAKARAMLFQKYKLELSSNKKAIAIEMMRMNELDLRAAHTSL